MPAGRPDRAIVLLVRLRVAAIRGVLHTILARCVAVIGVPVSGAGVGLFPGRAARAVAGVLVAGARSGLCLGRTARAVVYVARRRGLAGRQSAVQVQRVGAGLQQGGDGDVPVVRACAVAAEHAARRIAQHGAHRHAAEAGQAGHARLGQVETDLARQVHAGRNARLQLGGLQVELVVQPVVAPLAGGRQPPRPRLQHTLERRAAHDVPGLAPGAAPSFARVRAGQNRVHAVTYRQRDIGRCGQRETPIVRRARIGPSGRLAPRVTLLRVERQQMRAVAGKDRRRHDMGQPDHRARIARLRHHQQAVSPGRQILRRFLQRRAHCQRPAVGILQPRFEYAAQAQQLQPVGARLRDVHGHEQAGPGGERGAQDAAGL